MGNLLIVSFVYDYENIVHSTEHLESIEKCKEGNSNNIILILEITVVRIFIYFLFDRSFPRFLPTFPLTFSYLYSVVVFYALL